MSDVHPGGYGDSARGTGAWAITLVTLAVIGVLLLGFLAFSIVRGGTDGAGGNLVRFFPSGIDRSRTLPADQVPAGPSEYSPRGGVRGEISPPGGPAGEGGTVGGTGGVSGGPTGPTAGAGR